MSECMDNFRFDITARSPEMLKLALKVAFELDDDKPYVYGYSMGPAPKESASAAGGEWGANKAKARLVLYKYESAKATPLPYKMNFEQALSFVQGWLQNAGYGPQPDHDGSNSKGWRVYNEAWGHVNDDWAGFVAIEPVWALHGK
jgi:hypothetical protein